MEAITDEIPKLSINMADLGPERVINMPMLGKVIHFPEVGIRTRNAVVAFEEFEAGNTLKFCEAQNGVAIVIQGKAEISYSLPGTHWTEVRTMTVAAGDAYVIPKGGQMVWKVDPSSRYRHLWVSIPST